LASLWRNWRFQLLWVGSGSAYLGMGVADFAYPVVILVLTRSPILAAAFGAIQLTFSIVAGLPAGALVDRWDRRRLLIGAELGRAAMAASVCVALALGHLTIVHLMVVAAVLGAVGPLGASARMLVVRAVVPPAQLTQALTQDQVRSAVTGLAGPALGGFLLRAGMALPFLACAVTFLMSFVTALVVRIPDRAAAAPGAATPERDSMFAGVFELWANRVIRSSMLMICILNLGVPALQLALLVQLREHGTPVSSIGLAFTGEALGALLGAALVGPLHKWVAPGRLLLLAGAELTAAIALLAIPLGPWWVFGVLAGAVLSMPAISVLIDVLILRQVPDERRGRTMTALMTVMTIGMPVGTILGGALLSSAGPTITILTIAALCVIGLALGASDRHLWRAQWPASDVS
jgi:MFS family permease